MRRSSCCLAFAALVLAGCSSGPSQQDQAEWARWQQSVTVDEGGLAITGRAVAEANGDTAMVRLPQPMVVGLIELTCTGADVMTVGFTLVASAVSDIGGAEVPCDDAPHSAAVPEALVGQQVRTIMVAASSTDGTGAWGVVLTPRS